MSEFTVEIDREEDGRWIGEVTDLPGAGVRIYTRRSGGEDEGS